MPALQLAEESGPLSLLHAPKWREKNPAASNGQPSTGALLRLLRAEAAPVLVGQLPRLERVAHDCRGQQHDHFAALSARTLGAEQAARQLAAQHIGQVVEGLGLAQAEGLAHH